MRKAPNAFRMYYLQNLIPDALRGMAGYHALKETSFLCPRSRVWVSLRKTDSHDETFSIAGYILDSRMEKLVDFIFPGILQEAKECFNAFRLRGTESAVPGAVASESNMLFSECLVYCAVLWLQVRLIYT